jgi:hypothetical protein
VRCSGERIRRTKDGNNAMAEQAGLGNAHIN